MDKEEIIRRLKKISEHAVHVTGEPPFVMSLDDGIALDEAVRLLKEQEAVEPVLEQDSMVCGVCGHDVIWQKLLGDNTWADEELDYCPHCGRQVKWE